MTAEAMSSTMLKCSQCPKLFKYKSERKRHELSHSPQFQCSFCLKKFTYISALRRHEQHHNRTGTVECSKCGGKFRDKTLLKRHMDYSHKGTFSCKKCSSVFHSEKALETHLITHKPESERRFRCSFIGCDKTFNYPHHLKHHELAHTNSKQHFCNACGRGFIQLHHLKTHIKSHDLENWFTCNESNCNKKFATKYAYQKHLATHGTKFNDPLTRQSLHLAQVKSNKSVKSVGFKVKLKKSVKGRDSSIIKSQKSVKDVDLSKVKLKKSFKGAVKDTKKDAENILKEDASIEVKQADVKIEKNVSTVIMNNIEITTNCKSMLGSCLVDPNGKDCLCEQMTLNIDEPYDLTPIMKGKQNLENNNMVEMKDYEVPSNQCEGCECANICNAYTEKYLSNDVNKDDVPNIEYNNGIVKLTDTFDIDIPKFYVGKEDFKKDVGVNKNIESVPYNSCKDILGKCIVSGNGTISDNCLCAKMHFDELQVLAEEVQDIIVHPKDADFDNFVSL